MKVSEILSVVIVKHTQEVIIRDSDMNVLDRAPWTQESIMKYMNHEAESFAWQDDGKLFIDLK
mgnify:FL=1